MKVLIQNSQYNNKMLKHRSSVAEQNDFEFSETRIKKQESKVKQNRPAQAVSFSGSALSLGSKIAHSKAINKTISFVSNNEAAYNAIYSLIIAGILKPLAVMRQKGEEKDKQMIAVKNSLQAFIGSFLGLTVGGGIVKHIWDNISNNLNLIEIDGATDKITTVSADSPVAKEIARSTIIKENNSVGAKFKLAKERFCENQGIAKFTSFVKQLFQKIDIDPSSSAIDEKAKQITENFENVHKSIFSKNLNFVKILKSNEERFGAFEALWKNSAGAPVAIGKAKISSLLLPSVVAFIFAKKNLEEQQKKLHEKYSNMGITLTESSSFKDKQKAFNLLNPVENINFKGKMDKSLTSSLTKLFENMAMSKAGEKASGGLEKIANSVKSNPSAIMADFESIMLTGYWLFNTQTSKKINPDQKLGLNVHTALVTIISTICAHLVDALFGGMLKDSVDTYSGELKNMCEEIARQSKESPDPETLKNLVNSRCTTLFNKEGIVQAISKIDIKDMSAIDTVVRDLTKNYAKKLAKFKSLTIFTLVVRFLVPVLTVNLSARIKKYLLEYSKNKKEEAQANKQA